MTFSKFLLVPVFGLAACAGSGPQDWPQQGSISAAGGGASGYQHGPERTQLVIGNQTRRISKYGYVKKVGDQGALASNRANGSTFAVPSAQAASLRLPPYGKSSDDHDTYVKNYF